MNTGFSYLRNKIILPFSFLLTGILYLFVFPTSTLAAQSRDYIEKTFSVHPGYLYLADFDTFGKSVDPDKEPLPAEAHLPKEIEDKTYIYLLEEAAWILSGTIFGFRFEYRPGDKKRGIEEEFNVTPIGSIPRGNNRLMVLETGYTENNEEIYIRIRYHYSESEKRRLKLWSSTRFPTSGGIGGVPVNTEECDKAAIKEALKQAVRNHLRPLVRNKPGRISGTIALTDLPLIYYTAGSCMSKVTVVLQYDEIDHDQFPKDAR